MRVGGLVLQVQQGAQVPVGSAVRPLKQGDGLAVVAAIRVHAQAHTIDGEYSVNRRLRSGATKAAWASCTEQVSSSVSAHALATVTASCSRCKADRRHRRHVLLLLRNGRDAWVMS